MGLARQVEELLLLRLLGCWNRMTAEVQRHGALRRL